MTWCCTQCDKFEVKLRPDFELMKDTHISHLRARFGCVSWVIGEKWPQDIGRALHIFLESLLWALTTHCPRGAEQEDPDKVLCNLSGCSHYICCGQTNRSLLAQIVTASLLSWSVVTIMHRNGGGVTNTISSVLLSSGSFRIVKTHVRY